LTCLGCSLKDAEGAGAQCSVYGHKNALRTTDGRTWTILENDASKELISSHDYTGKKVSIEGKKYPKAQVVEVESFEVAG